jgi:hypothetical protein
MQEKIIKNQPQNCNMQKEIISYNELVMQEEINIQRGMNFRPAGKDYSILLMSVREDSPYNDTFDEENKLLYYEGEDVSKIEKEIPKKYDQPFFKRTGRLTNNGIFFKAAEEYSLGRRQNPEKIRVYEKIDRNVWADKGLFNLIDAKYEFSEKENRKDYKFIVQPIDLAKVSKETFEDFEFSRRIPTNIKRLIWERDGGKCVECGGTLNLHFDHIIPFSKGGSSTDPKNIQILCGKHNLQKSAHII